MPPISNPPRISCASRYSRSVLHIGREFCELFARHSTRPTHGFLALNSKCITRLQPPPPEGKKRTAFRCTMSGALKLVIAAQPFETAIRGRKGLKHGSVLVLE